jgi:N-acetylglucosamine-6-sulfatase
MPRLLVQALVVGLLALVPASASSGPASPAAAGTQPNVVLVYVDDMRADDLAYMPYTRSLFDDGTTFTHAISPHPLCCPARAELMTGQYAQNNGVHHNRGEWGGHEALVRAGDQALLPGWFQAAGYETSYVGKYLNGYTGGQIPGTTTSEVLLRRSYAPTLYSTWQNGEVRRHREAQTTWTARRTRSLIEDAPARRPFFLTAAYLAPHTNKWRGSWVPPVPPKGYDDVRRRDRRPPSLDDPAFNEADMTDKPSTIADRPGTSREAVRKYHRARVLSLYAVDDAMRSTVRALKRADAWEDTVLAFTSDNGFQLGEHRLWNKDQPYQESLRVPLMVRGPGVGQAQRDEVVTTVDLPRTLASLAGVVPGRLQDGVDAFTAPSDRAVLIQSGADDAQWDWRGVYTRRWTYVEHTTGETEMYDRVADPHELENLAGRPAYLDDQQRLAEVYRSLRGCSGPDCVATAS